MEKLKIIQIIPLGTEYENFRDVDYVEPGWRKMLETTYHVVGAALMNNGRVLPLLWDGCLRFTVVDPTKVKWKYFFEAEMDELPF